MEEENPSEGVIAMVPLALSILALVLGAAGLYVGISASQRIAPLSESVEAGTSSAAVVEEQISGTEAKLAEFEKQLGDLKNSVNRMRLNGPKNERALQQVATAVQENRKEMVKLAEGLNKLVSGGVTPARTQAASSSTSTDSSAETSAVSDAPNTYKIQAGDNFGKIARKLGVGLQALLDANADKDPRKLTIGTVINVPTN